LTFGGTSTRCLVLIAVFLPGVRFNIEDVLPIVEVAAAFHFKCQTLPQNGLWHCTIKPASDGLLPWIHGVLYE
jgi:hypothetical protein